jgi:hypothetical protein
MTLATRRAALTSLTGVLIAAATAVTIGQAAARPAGRGRVPARSAGTRRP